MNKVLYTSFLLEAGPTHIRAQTSTPPSIVLILCGDAGSSDLGCCGGEIQTPSVDSLTGNGVRLSLFKNTGRSCPSHVASLTGRRQHEVGMGWMATANGHRPGYRRQITKSTPTIVKVMKMDGYSTYISGKWYVTVDGTFDAPNSNYPAQRGFNKYYGCLSGGGNYHKPTPVYSNLTRTAEFPGDYYYTTAITDSVVSFVKQYPAGKPMLMYVAHYAPHLPLRTPADRMGKCINRYKVGYDVLRRQRFSRLKKLKFILGEMDCPVFQKEFGGKHPSWGTLTRKQQEQRITDMAAYATMIEIVGNGIGELVEAIRQKGVLDNTVPIFLGDNGAAEEDGYLGQLMVDLSNVPYRSYKSQCFQGGINIPFVLPYGDAEKNKMRGQICKQSAHIIDTLPTYIDLAVATYPSGSRDNLPGKGLLPSVNEKKIKPRGLYFEHRSSCVIISDHWGLVRGSQNKPWELVDLKVDPFETKDLSIQYPKEMKKPEAKWNRWTERSNVFPFEDKPWSERVKYYIERNPDQSGKEAKQ